MISKLLFLFVSSLFLLLSLAQDDEPQFSQQRSCQRAFDQCKFSFAGFRTSIPTFKISGPQDLVFTPRIISKNTSETIGICNTNKNPSDFIFVRYWLPINIVSSKPRLAPTHFKAYPILTHPKMVNGSGIGHQTFTGTQLNTAANKCVRVYISEYQLLHPDTYYVLSNVNAVSRSENRCVVFRTTL